MWSFRGGHGLTYKINISGLDLNSDKPRSHLIIPDRQATPGCNFLIDQAIGNFILKKKPDVIVNIGDHADMPSLSTYDIGKKSFEGRRYHADIEASIEAHKRMFGPLIDYNRMRIKNKQAVYRPLTVMTLGNHENRINRAINDDPKLEGLISIADLNYEDWYDIIEDFLKPVIIDGVCYVHYAYKKMPSSPIGGKHQARAILDSYMMSTTVGHTPEFDYAECYRGDDKRIQCIVAGACFDHEEDYAGARNRRYWRGIILKHEVKDGNYDFERIGIDRLLRDYA